VEAELSLSFQLMSAESSLSACPYSEDILLLSWTLIGMWLDTNVRSTHASRNPFDDHLLASASDDCKVFLWRVPENFTLNSDAEDPPDVAPVGRLTGHSRYETRFTIETIG
jgi:hypothetical protein